MKRYLLVYFHLLLWFYLGSSCREQKVHGEILVTLKMNMGQSMKGSFWTIQKWKVFSFYLFFKRVRSRSSQTIDLVQCKLGKVLTLISPQVQGQFYFLIFFRRGKCLEIRGLAGEHINTLRLVCSPFSSLLD